MVTPNTRQWGPRLTEAGCVCVGVGVGVGVRSSSVLSCNSLLQLQRLYNRAHYLRDCDVDDEVILAPT